MGSLTKTKMAIWQKRHTFFTNFNMKLCSKKPGPVNISIHLIYSPKSETAINKSRGLESFHCSYLILCLFTASGLQGFLYNFIHNTSKNEMKNDFYTET
jgi:hypothetical protein